LETPTPDLESELRSPRTPQGGGEHQLAIITRVLLFGLLSYLVVI
jgi:hypothetical protein